MAPPTKPKAKTAKTEEKDLVKTILTWGFVVCGIGAIVYMVAMNPKQKHLNCSRASTGSFMGFGTCTEE